MSKYTRKDPEQRKPHSRSREGRPQEPKRGRYAGRNYVSEKDPFGHQLASRKHVISDEMLPQQIEKRRQKLKEFKERGVTAGRQVCASTPTGQRWRGLYSRMNPKTGYFFMKKSRIVFDPLTIEVQLQENDLVTFKNERPIHLILEVRGHQVRLPPKEDKNENWVPASNLVFVRTLTAGYQPKRKMTE